MISPTREKELRIRASDYVIQLKAEERSAQKRPGANPLNFHPTNSTSFMRGVEYAMKYLKAVDKGLPKP